MNDQAPHPPGDYPVVVVGSGPGGLQTAYFLRQLGIGYAHISGDDSPGGMFRQFPLFERLITWTKPHAPADPGSERYEWYDWNSLLADEPELKALAPKFLDGSSYFPSRSEMAENLVAFAEGSGLPIRYNCRWESTRKTEDGFVLVTSDGEYRCQTVVFAVGMTEPWKPDIPGIEHVPHYADVRRPPEYRGKKVLVLGKRASGFEIADGLLTQAKQLILISPRPAKLSVTEASTATIRARYLQPFEDAKLGGGNLVLDAATERIERTEGGFRVLAKGTSRPGDFTFDVDAVIAATGFRTPLRDLPELGLATFYGDGRLPAQTPFWESPSLPGIYFAGSITQGAIGLKKYGLPSNSAAVHGFRYNAKVLVTHLASKHFGVTPPRPSVARGDLADVILKDVTDSPALWNQQSYLARVYAFDEEAGVVDNGLLPLADFVDSAGPTALASAVETDDKGDIHPVLYSRKGGSVEEHLLESDLLHNFQTEENRKLVAAALTKFD